MRKTIIAGIVIALLAFGCATTPQSITRVSAVELQMWDAIKADFHATVTAYDAGRQHWVLVAYQRALREAEEKLTDANGRVDLAKYKAERDRIVSQLAEVQVKNDADLQDILAAFDDKIIKAKYMAQLINEYENSTGVAPETVQMLLDEALETSKALAQIIKTESARKASQETGTDWKSLLDLTLNKAYENVTSRLTPTMPVKTFGASTAPVIVPTP